MKKLIVLSILIVLAINAFSQSVNDRAKVLYFSAENAYNNEAYQECIDKINQIEKLLGKTNSKVLELKIKAQFNNGNYVDAYHSKTKFFDISTSQYPGYNNILRMTIDIEDKAKPLFFNEGVKQYKNGNYSVAVENFELCSASQSNDDGLEMLSRSYYEIGEYDKAKDSFEKLLNLNVADDSIKRYYYLTLIEINQDEKTITHAKNELRKIADNKKMYEDYKNAKAINTLDAYNNFMQSYPDNKYASDVLDEIIKINANANLVSELDNLLNEGFIDDRDGSTYELTKINNQIWFRDNLKYHDGEPLNSKSKWKKLYDWESAFCYYNNDALNQNNGVLYNFIAADRECPYGWHLPSNSEWVYALNSSNYKDLFVGSPYGYRNSAGKYLDEDYKTYFWSNSETVIDAFGWVKYKGTDRLMAEGLSKNTGAFVRCVYDKVYPTAININDTSFLNSSNIYLKEKSETYIGTLSKVNFENKNLVEGNWVRFANSNVYAGIAMLNDEVPPEKTLLQMELKDIKNAFDYGTQFYNHDTIIGSLLSYEICDEGLMMIENDSVIFHAIQDEGFESTVNVYDEKNNTNIVNNYKLKLYLVNENKLYYELYLKSNQVNDRLVLVVNRETNGFLFRKERNN